MSAVIDIASPEEAAYDRYLAALRERGEDNPGTLITALLELQSGMTLSDELAQIDRLKEWLDGFRPFPPDAVAELRRLYEVRFTYHSNAIEGNTLTQSETEMVLEKGITVGGKTLAEHLEAVGHRDAIGYIEQLARQETPMGEREIRDLHALIFRAIDQVTGTTDAGRYRALDVRAAGTEHVYPPHYRLPELMEGFVRWLASDEAAALHPVVRAADAHYRFASIHPFRDGNGRTARLLMNLLLLRDGYPIAVIPRERRTAYIDALVHAQQHDGDLEPLTALVADACRESLIEYLRVLSTAGGSRGKGLPFYQEMLAFLDGGEG
jgi:Fic family protein